MLESLGAVLRSGGHKVEQVSSGLAALEVIERTSIDLLLTDVVMRGMNGFTLAREAVTRRPRLKVLYFSGFTDFTIGPDNGLKFGKLLHKPLRADDLRREIAQALVAGRS